MDKEISPAMLANLQNLMWLGEENFDLAALTAKGLGCWETVVQPILDLQQISYYTWNEPKDFLKLTELKILSNMPKLPADCILLKYLQKIEIGKIGLEAMPESIRNWQDLRYLNCSHNQLSSLPEDLYVLPLLGTLRASYNQLPSLPLSFWESPYMSEIFLSHNQLRQLPEPQKHIPTLTNGYYQLDLSYNLLEMLPKNFGILKCIHRLNLSNNRLKSLPLSMAEIRFGDIYLSNNQLSDLPDWFKETNFNTLDLRKNPISLKNQRKIRDWFPTRTIFFP